MLLLFNFLFSFGQNKISGEYYNEYGSKIEIKDDRFRYIKPHQSHPIWYNDTLVECIFKWIDDQFIELNSTPSYIIAQKGLKVVQSLDLSMKDSLKVSFSIPYQRADLNVSVITNTFKVFDLNYSKNNREIMLPSNTKTITFSISPGEYLPMHSVEGYFYGVLYYSSIEYPIEKNVNCIEIEIPAIDDSFFEKYYVKGDYAKVSKDSIVWKGDIFVKKK